MTRPDRTGSRQRRGQRQPRSGDGAETLPHHRSTCQRLTAWLTCPFALALGSGLLLWASLPPLSWWPLGWIAPIGWLWLIARPTLGQRRPYWAIWLASVIYWVLVMQGIRLAHWANYIGLTAMSCYLGIYLPLFIAIGRIARHRWRLPLVIVAPVAWTGMELARGYGPLAFSMALLAHSQVKQPLLIQVADLFGPYTVSFIVMCVAACIFSAWPSRQHRWRFWPLLLASGLITLTLLYGRYRLTQVPPGSARSPVRVAIIQGSIDTLFEDNPERPQETLEQYTQLTVKACQKYQPVDLVIWPETMFQIDDILVDAHGQPRLEPPWDRSVVEQVQRIFRRHIGMRVQLWNNVQRRDATDENRRTSWIFGVPTWQFGDYRPRRYNTAMMVTPQGKIVGRYYKMRPVIFGEYVPLGDIFPALYHLFPMPNGLTRGTQPVVWNVDSLKMSPSICFESTMPQLIRWQVSELDRRGESPDVLVNLTNDGWFWGSSILDMQLNCAIFRAVEMRRPFLVAANTGFSAWIDGNGRLLAQGPRHASGTLLAKVVPDGRLSRYEQWGDLPGSICVLFCVLVALSGIGQRWRRRAGADGGLASPPASNST